VSLIYATSFAGSLIAGLFNVWITDRIGFGLATPLGAIFTMVSYMLMGTGAHYALFLVAFALTGFGMSLQDAQVNNLCSRLPDAGNKMMFVQACFGLGGTLAPLAATAFAEHVEKEAYRYFFVAMGVAFIALLFMILAFDGCTEEQIENWRQAEWATDKDKGIKDDKDKDDKSSENTTEKKRAVEGEVEIAQMPDVTIIDRDGTVPPLVPAAEPKVPQTSGQKMKRIFKTPAVYALMGFSFLYVGDSGIHVLTARSVSRSPSRVGRSRSSARSVEAPLPQATSPQASGAA
jgi:MFS family permease